VDPGARPSGRDEMSKRKKHAEPNLPLRWIPEPF
jgi:hypothetical protein